MPDEFANQESAQAYDKVIKAPEEEVASSEESPKRVDQVVTGKAARRKKRLGTKLREMFVGADADTVRDYVVHDVLVPALKDMISDATSGGIDRILFGDDARTHRRGSRSRFDEGPKISYHRMSPVSDRRHGGRRHHEVRSRRRSNRIDEIILESRADADEVLGKMYDLLERYDSVSVSDLNTLVGLSGPFTDDNWGWDRLDGARTRRLRDGRYLLELPDPIELD